MLKKEQHTAAEVVNIASASLGNAVLLVLKNSCATVCEKKKKKKNVLENLLRVQTECVSICAQGTNNMPAQHNPQHN